MKVLSLDTAFPVCNVAVCDLESGISVARSVPMLRGQAEQLIPLMEEVMATAPFGYDDLDLIVVTVGPGSFTGVRVGLAAARGLGVALDIPVQGVVTTDALYATWREQGGRGAARVVIDTKRDDLFEIDYESEAYLPCNIDDIHVRDPKDSVLDLASVPYVGDGISLISGAENTSVLWPDPVVLAEFGAFLYADAAYPRRAIASPVYIREAEVSVSKQQLRPVINVEDIK